MVIEVIAPAPYKPCTQEDAIVWRHVDQRQQNCASGAAPDSIDDGEQQTISSEQLVQQDQQLGTDPDKPVPVQDVGVPKQRPDRAGVPLSVGRTSLGKKECYARAAILGMVG